MVQSRRKLRETVARAKSRPIKWYTIRMVFWALVLAFGFVMFMFGWIIGRYVT